MAYFSAAIRGSSGPVEPTGTRLRMLWVLDFVGKFRLRFTAVSMRVTFMLSEMSPGLLKKLKTRGADTNHNAMGPTCTMHLYFSLFFSAMSSMVSYPHALNSLLNSSVLSSGRRVSYIQSNVRREYVGHSCFKEGSQLQ